MRNQSLRSRSRVRVIAGGLVCLSVLGMGSEAVSKGLMAIEPWLEQARKDLQNLVKPGVVTMPQSRISERQFYERMILQLETPVRQAVSASGQLLDEQNNRARLRQAIKKDVKLVKTFGHEYRSTARKNIANPVQEEDSTRRVSSGMTPGVSNTRIEDRNVGLSREAAKVTAFNSMGNSSGELRGLLRAEQVRLGDVKINRGVGNSGTPPGQADGNPGQGNAFGLDQIINQGNAFGVVNNPGQGNGNSNAGDNGSGNANNNGNMGQGNNNSSQGNAFGVTMDNPGRGNK